VTWSSVTRSGGGRKPWWAEPEQAADAAWPEAPSLRRTRRGSIRVLPSSTATAGVARMRATAEVVVDFREKVMPRA
jgi:hypothetical protein